MTDRTKIDQIRELMATEPNTPKQYERWVAEAREAIPMLLVELLQLQVEHEQVENAITTVVTTGLPLVLRDDDGDRRAALLPPTLYDAVMDKYLA